MKSFRYIIQEEMGLHARPAGIMVKTVRQIPDKVMIHGNGKSADAAKLMAIMSMGVKKGMEVEVTVEGEQEEETAAALEQFFMDNF